MALAENRALCSKETLSLDDDDDGDGDGDDEDEDGDICAQKTLLVLTRETREGKLCFDLRLGLALGLGLG